MGCTLNFLSPHGGSLFNYYGYNESIPLSLLQLKIGEREKNNNCWSENFCNTIIHLMNWKHQWDFMYVCVDMWDLKWLSFLSKQDFHNRLVVRQLITSALLHATLLQMSYSQFVTAKTNFVISIFYPHNLVLYMQLGSIPFPPLFFFAILSSNPSYFSFQPLKNIQKL